MQKNEALAKFLRSDWEAKGLAFRAERAYSNWLPPIAIGDNPEVQTYFDFKPAQPAAPAVSTPDLRFPPPSRV
jgi:hypothetical protein